MATSPRVQLDAESLGGNNARSLCKEWSLSEFGVVDSTNLVAADLGAWAAVRADQQTSGRGRFQRTWVSDLGGLWLSAVVPIREEIVARRALPLAAGLAVCNSLEELRVGGIRLRWPNDVMLNERKLAGLLVDQFRPGLAVIGIGMNVRNRPESSEPALSNHVARLVEVMPIAPRLDTLTSLILRHLREVLITLDQTGAAPLFMNVNKLWGQRRFVELDLDGKTVRGLFTGIDSQGRLILADSTGNNASYDAHEVCHLTEI